MKPETRAALIAAELEKQPATLSVTIFGTAVYVIVPHRRGFEERIVTAIAEEDAFTEALRAWIATRPKAPTVAETVAFARGWKP